MIMSRIFSSAEPGPQLTWTAMGADIIHYDQPGQVSCHLDCGLGHFPKRMYHVGRTTLAIRKSLQSHGTKHGMQRVIFHSNFHAWMTRTMADAISTQGRRGIPRVGVNVMSNWGNYVFTAVVSFFLAPFIVGHLGASGYGVWTLVVSLTGYLGLLDMGVRGAVTRYVAKYHTQEEHEEVGRIVSSAFVIFVSIGVLSILTSAGLALFAIPYFSIPAAYQTQARVVLLVAGLNVAFSLIGGVFGGVIIGLQRFDVSNTVEVLSTGIRSLFVVLVLKGGGGIVALSGVQLAFSVLGCVVYYWVAKRLCPHLTIGFNQADRQQLSLIFSFSAYSFVLQISTYLIYYTDSVVIGAFLPVSAITFFAIAGNLMNYARAPISSISVTMTPLASSVEARSDYSQLRLVTLKASRYATAIMLPVAITFLLRGRSFIGLWMGASYAEVSGRVLSILTIAWLFSAGNAVLGATMMGISKHKGIIPAELGEGLLNLALVSPAGFGYTSPDPYLFHMDPSRGCCCSLRRVHLCH